MRRWTLPLWPRPVLGKARDERAQGLVEYVLLVSIVGIALIGALVLYRSSLAGLYNLITHRL